MNQPLPPVLPGTKPPTKGYTWKDSAPAAYVAEEDLVGHHWEERPLGIANFICPSTGECQGQEAGVGG